MITQQPRLTNLQGILISKQWNAIQVYATDIFHGYRERMIDARLYGSHTFQTIIPKTGITNGDLGECTLAINRDPRLLFLTRLPEIIRFWASFGDAVGKSFSVSPDSSFREVAASIGIFVRILDSLIDDAPDLVAPELPILLKSLDKKSWEVHGNFSGAAKSNHPALVLLYKFLSYSVDQIKESRYWRSEESFAVRDTFSTAVERALFSEYQISKCTLKETSEGFDPDMRGIFEQKPQNMMLAIALAPIAVTGWPEQLDQIAFEDSMRNFGRLIGWLDDLNDIRDDLAAGNWNEVLLDIYEWSCKPTYSSVVELSENISDALQNDLIVEELVSKGVNIYRQALKGFETIGTDPLPLQQFATDVTIAWMTRPSA